MALAELLDPAQDRRPLTSTPRSARMPAMRSAAAPSRLPIQPIALRDLADSIQRQLERELRAAPSIDSSVFVKAYWLRAESSGYGFPDYRHAYVWIAPVVMSPTLCEVIETFVVSMRGVTETGRGGEIPDTAGSN